MTEQFTLEKHLQLSIERVDTDTFIVRANDENGHSVSPSELVSYLFFNDEQTFFGLLTETTEDHLILKADQLLQSFPESHPYVKYTGLTEDDTKQLHAVREAADGWRKPELWKHAKADEHGIHFDTEKLDVSTDAAQVLQSAVYSKLANAMIRPEQLTFLLPHIQKYGWPGESQTTIPVRTALRLTEPEEESDSTEWLLETIVINERGRHWTPAIRKKHLPIAEALTERWKPYATEILKRQSEMLSFLQSLQPERQDQFLSIPMADAEVRIFLQEDLPLLQSFGYPVILPAWLKSITESKMRVRTNASVQSYQSATGLDEVLAFDWSFSLGGNEIDQQSFQRLVDENREYIRSGDEWFHIDPVWLQKIRDLMERADAGEWTVKDLLFQEIPEEIAPLANDDEELESDPLLEFSMQKSLRTYMETLAEKKGLPSAGIPAELNATLRPYQEDGYNWLVFMRDNHFGACLADDMGLGKTVQLITYLLNVHNRPETTGPSLIVCPTSVLGNWQKELERFAPSLSVHLHYGPSREKDEAFTTLIQSEKPDVILTTYGTASQDGEMLAETEFTAITLDEAQNIKNMQTKQSRAIRKLHGQHHIALTGTPIENRLSELWAIFDFIHRGYFGNFRTFTDQFIIPIERDDSERDKRKLRAKIRPFLLRRTKSDPDLLLNLPKKLEQNEYTPLTTEQAALYESFLDETKFKLQTLTGFEKKGLVLTMLNRLKQLCNHPALFLKEPNRPASEMVARSEKLKSIVSMSSNIAANGEQCIIFTQYIGMGRLIQHCLSELHDIDAPFLTGSMPKTQRDGLVDEFQKGSFPIFILSLRAGGTGLNLTAANHVLHADRWWNPAVENQATDRAYRIGQTKFVHVHKFVTIGTIEEKIDKMLEEKAALSADLILSNQWLADLSDNELDDLLSFG
ncbi:DEAD/DEAH box helicase [Sporosarcina ureilytica]|uniref:ATP-dependent helicase n=1 Tax=Sporosarcina ureilytica TaxID=298596 RepID=A0A1D8JJE3_9BACL|nr:DEAD/DEAH box helicase [Sporosarcina ureilytica]AOV08810.1 ATP-dependent helicase [Sporosarcina ureilytica]